MRWLGVKTNMYEFKFAGSSEESFTFTKALQLFDYHLKNQPLWTVLSAGLASNSTVPLKIENKVLFR